MGVMDMGVMDMGVVDMGVELGGCRGFVRKRLHGWRPP